MKSAFFSRHPLVNAVYFLGVVVLSMIFIHPVFIAVSFSGAFACAVRLDGASVIKRFFTWLLPLFAAVSVFNTVLSDYGETVLLSVFGKAFTLEALVYGAVTGSMVITLILWLMSFSRIVTEEKIMTLFGKKVPSVAMLFMIIFRFVPLYSQHFSDASAARKGMGLEKTGGFSAKLKNAVVCAAGVINRSLEHSIETADSMKSRGYGLKERTSYSRFTFRPADGALLTAEIVLIVLVAIFKIYGTGYASYNPTIEIGSVSLLAAAAFALFCFLPIIIDLTEALRWNRLYAKI